MKGSMPQYPGLTARPSALSPRTMAQPYTAVGSTSGSISSLAEGEEQEMIKALKSPLLIQTPLQVVLETMYDKLRTQTDLCMQLQDRVRKLEKFNVDGHELLERLRILEDRVEVLNKTRLPDFEPADVYRRLDELAASSQQLHEAITAHKIQQEQDVQPRLAALEQRLAGTFNLAGHMIAVADMAGELGVPLPDLDATGSQTVGAAIAKAAADTAGPFRGSLPVAAAGVAAAAAGGCAAAVPTASGSSTRLASLQQQVDSGKAEAGQLRAEIRDIKYELGGLDQALAEAVHNSTSRFKGLEETAGDISKNLAQEVESLKQALQRRGDDISYTEFVKLQRQVEALQEAAGSSGAAVQQLYDKELVRLREGLEGLQRHVGGMSGVRDVDQVFGGQLAELKAEVEAIKFTLEQRARPGVSRSNSKVGSGGGFLPRIGSRPASPGNDGSMADVVVGSAHAPAGGQAGHQEGSSSSSSSSRHGSQAGSLAGFPGSRSRPASPSLPAGLMKPPVFVEE